MNNIQRLAFIKFTLWLLTLVLIVFIGTTNVFAEQVDVGYTTSKTTVLFENNQAQAMTSLAHTTSVNQYLYNILVIQLNNQSILKDYLYQLEIYTPNAKLKNISNIYIVGGNNNSTVCQTIGLDTSNTSYPKIYFTCPSNVNSLTFGLNNDSPTTLTEPITTGTNFQWNYTYLRYFTEDDDIDLGPVISNQQQNTQDIINNQNNLLGSKCPNLFNKSTLTMGDYTGSYSTIRASIRQSIYLEAGTYTFKTDLPLSTYQVAIDILPNAPPSSSYNTIQSTGYISSNSITFNVTTAGYFVLTFKKGSNSTFSINDINTYNYQLVKGNSAGNFCDFGSYISKLDDVSGAVNGVTDALTDDSPISLSSISSTAGWLPAGPIDSIINLPLNLFNGLLTALNGTCQPLHVPIPYLDNKYMDIPCISTIFNQIEGLPNFWNWVGAICSVVILYRYLLALYKYYDDLTTLKANFISDFGGAP